jgi:ribosomal protein S18 acetylase RimI-like enzyme
MKMKGLEFKPIDLTKHAEVCVRFRADSFVVSFGSDAAFHEADGRGAERYLEWLKTRISELPGSCVHIWDDDRIIGQMEIRRSQDHARRGHVNLFYLVPEYRGRGVGQELEAYASRFFAGLGWDAARLTVSSTNIPAVKFYRKHGWIDLGPSEVHPEVQVMEKQYQPSGGSDGGFSPSVQGCKITIKGTGQ